MSGNTTNWAIPYATSGDASNPNLWDQSRLLAQRVDTILQNGNVWTNVTLAAGMAAPPEGSPLGVRRVLGMMELYGGLTISTPADLDNVKIGTLPAGFGYLGDTWFPGGIALVGTDWVPCPIRVAISDVYVSTPGVASRINIMTRVRVT